MAVTKGQYVHKTFKSYDGDETGNIFASQIGWNALMGATGADGHEHIAGSGTDIAGVRTHHPNVRYWISMKAVHGSDSSIIAQTANGDNFSLDGSYASLGNARNIDLQAEDMVNGIFTRIRICDGVTVVLAQRG